MSELFVEEFPAKKRIESGCMNCYKLINGVFEPYADPIGDDAQSGGYVEQLYAAGYLAQLSSLLRQSEDSEITVYATSEPGKPTYYIDISGKVSQMAVLLADDFPHLVATLKEIAPLVALIGLAQQSEQYRHRVAQDQNSER